MPKNSREAQRGLPVKHVFDRRARWRVAAATVACALSLGIIAPLGASATLPAASSERVPQNFQSAYSDLGRTVVLIGDSQTHGAVGIAGSRTWVQQAFSSLGYQLVVNGTGGTGFVASTARAKNYPDALASGAWTLPNSMLPWSRPPLVVVQGGGNDARKGATDAEILANATRLLNGLTATYPRSRIVFIGALGKGLATGGRRAQVDALIGGFAKSRGLSFVSVGNWLTKFDLTRDLADNVHLDAAGHRILTGALRDQLATLGIVGPDAG